MSNQSPFYITTPIYYVNDVPHIGHAYTTIAADVLARYWRLRGRDVFFLTGLDEHGQKVQQAAAKAGIDPQAHCDKLAPQFQKLWERLNISNDAFIRTTETKHKEIVQRYLQQLYDDKLVYKADYTGWYCTFDERFWTEKDVIDGLCPDCNRPVEQLSEHNYFFKMGQYQDRLIEHITQHPNFIRPESRRNEVLGFLTTQKLGDLSISRPKSRLSWGIELPFDKDYVTYVWFDALVNYVSALEYLPNKPAFDQFWPANVHLVGKDILTTHAVYWSTMLMALNLPLPETIFAHGWWTVDGEKMSKSRGNVVDPNKMVDEFGADAFRYFLLREVPFGQDGDFSRNALIGRINSELANDLGNLLSRVLTLIERFANGVTPQPTWVGSHPQEDEVKTIALELFDKTEDAINDFDFNRALKEVWKLVDRTNLYIEQMAPWNLAKKESGQEKLVTVLYTSREALRFIALFLKPFMPNAAESIYRQLGLGPIPDDALKHGSKTRGWGWDHGQAIKEVSLFPRIEVSTKAKGETRVTEQLQPTSTPQQSAITPAAPTPAVPAQITIDEFMKIQLKTAKVLTAERVPKSDKLLKLQVSLGEGAEQRQIVAGIGKKYEPEALIGKTIIIVANLKPAKLMGIESQGMVLAAGDSEVRGLATILEEVDPGTKVK
jgi:methionyl-tRNA synthetase